MNHGSSHYFAERARFETRLSRITAAISLIFLVLLLALGHSPARNLIDDPEHFGFEGPERYVQRIELEVLGPRQPGMSNSGLAYVPRLTAGGGSGRERRPLRERGTEVSRAPIGLGASSANLLAKALRRSSDVPLVQSQELVFERLVRPSYPEEARRRGIEGRFSILALIDTSGRVVEVQVQSGDPNGLLEREAAAAVLRCVIRPYRVSGLRHEIVARFPFNFYLRD
ncbi:MAG TPA: energy transducer TonB [Candidatus Udaeobacter sp.]|jgi:TonB family protein|nr:energy transducer TonB [Candidatus Udaeobacter sp.]